MRVKNYEVSNLRTSGLEVFSKKVVLRNFSKFTGKHLCQNLFFNKVAGLRPANFIKKYTLAHMFSCEFCEISKNSFFHRTPLVAASVLKITKMAWIVKKTVITVDFWKLCET